MVLFFWSQVVMVDFYYISEGLYSFFPRNKNNHTGMAKLIINFYLNYYIWFGYSFKFRIIFDRDIFYDDDYIFDWKFFLVIYRYQIGSTSKDSHWLGYLYSISKFNHILYQNTNILAPEQTFYEIFSSWYRGCQYI